MSAVLIRQRHRVRISDRGPCARQPIGQAKRFYRLNGGSNPSGRSMFFREVG
jgi:hypothetical protein